jgi:hypothetical protein
MVARLVEDAYLLPVFYQGEKAAEQRGMPGAGGDPLTAAPHTRAVSIQIGPR